MLVNFMLQGKLCQEIVTCIYGANLCALNKKDGGLRPIAVGCTFRRLCAKVCCTVYQEKCRNYFQPFQLGFGTRQGCESIIHATRTFIDENRGSDFVLLKIDYKNAFNCIERDVLLKEVKEHTPEMYPFLWQCYASPSMLFFGHKTIPSQVGCQQGDPTSTLTFSLAIHPIVRMLKSKLNLFYLDDGTLAGDPKTVLEDVNTLIRESKKIGLTINPTKCELHFISNIVDSEIQSQFESVMPGIRIVSPDALTLLGSPLCSEGFQAPLEERPKKQV
uniref:Reverse transcriptase domain-containing protein n=1 Tax=Cacopsylla melanoneura TaxID=428564 RepID=A0A8D9A4C8_9HEMI